MIISLEDLDIYRVARSDAILATVATPLPITNKKYIRAEYLVQTTLKRGLYRYASGPTHTNAL